MAAVRANKAEHVVKSYAAGIGGQGAMGPPIQCIGRTHSTHWIKRREEGKEKKKKRNRLFLELPQPMAGS